MEALEEKLKRLLEANLADGVADLETLPGGKVSGNVVSSEFEDKDFDERRKRIREVLADCVKKNELADEEVLKISLFLTFTPDEWSVQLEDSA